MGEEDKIRKELTLLQKEHKHLDSSIHGLIKIAGDQMLMQRLKKRKLLIKDKIAQLQSFLYDDIIA